MALRVIVHLRIRVIHIGVRSFDAWAACVSVVVIGVAADQQECSAEGEK
jgi:hypothetical protein